MTEIEKPTNGFAKRPGQPGRFYFRDFLFSVIRKKTG